MFLYPPLFFMFSPVKTRRVVFPLVGLILGFWQTPWPHQDGVAWLAAHCRSSSPCPCFVGRFKKFMCCDHGLKVYLKKEEEGKKSTQWVWAYFCAGTVQNLQVHLRSSFATSPMGICCRAVQLPPLPRPQSDHRGCGIHAPCFGVKLC